MTDKPELGPPPAYSSPRSSPWASDPVDATVLQLIIDEFRGCSLNTQLFSDGVQAQAKAQGITEEAFSESMHALTSDRIVDAQEFVGGQRWSLRDVADRVWRSVEEEAGTDLGQLQRVLLAALVNRGGDGVGNPAHFLHVHPRTARAVLRELERERLLKFVQDVNGELIVTNVGPLAVRALRNQA